MYGKRIRELRLEKCLSQQELAEKLQTTQKNISKYELEFLDLSTDMIIRICKFFEISSDYLLGLEDEAGSKTYISNSFNNFNNSGNFKL